MIVHLKNFDQNTDNFAEIAKSNKKTIRIATKSVRVPFLIQRCLQRHPDVFQGLMCYNVHEALFLANELPNVDDFMVAYPCTQRCDVLAAVAFSKTFSSRHLTLMIDCVEHVSILDRLWGECQGSVFGKLSVCIDADMSSHQIPSVHVGVHRCVVSQRPLLPAFSHF